MAQRVDILGWARAAVGRLFASRRTKDQPIGGWVFPTGTKIPGLRLYDWRQPMQIPAVWRCVTLVSNTIAMLPWRVMRETADGKREAQPENRIDWMLHRRPSADMTAFAFKQTLLLHSILQGNGYAEIERDRLNRPVALWLIDDPDRVTVGRDNRGRIAYAVRQADGGHVVVPGADMLHVRSPSTDGAVGLGLLEVAARSIASNLALEELQPVYFRQGMRTPGFIKTKGKMSPESLKTVMKMIRENFAGLHNFELPIPLDADMEFTPAGSNFRDAQYIDLRKFGVIDICRWIGVPPHKAYDLERATFSNIEHQSQDFLTDTLLPRIVPLEQEADVKLLSDNWGGLYSKVNVNAIVRADMGARLAYYRGMFDMGALTVNDILSFEDMSTIGPEGDERTRSVQYQSPPTSDAGGDDAGEDDPEPPSPPKNARAGGVLLNRGR